MTAPRFQDLADRFTALGESRDPDGHEVRFYTTTHHSEPPGDGVARVEDPRETAEAAERGIVAP